MSILVSKARPLERICTQIVSDRKAEIRLIIAVTCSQDLGTVRVGNEEVDDVKETRDAIQIVFSDGNESNWNTGGDPDSILGVQVLETAVFHQGRQTIALFSHGFNASLRAILRIGSIVKSLQGKRGRCRDIRSHGGQELLNISSAIRSFFGETRKSNAQ